MSISTVTSVRPMPTSATQTILSVSVKKRLRRRAPSSSIDIQTSPTLAVEVHDGSIDQKERAPRRIPAARASLMSRSIARPESHAHDRAAPGNSGPERAHDDGVAGAHLAG